MLKDHEGEFAAIGDDLTPVGYFPTYDAVRKAGKELYLGKYVFVQRITEQGAAGLVEIYNMQTA